MEVVRPCRPGRVSWAVCEPMAEVSRSIPKGPKKDGKGKFPEGKPGDLTGPGEISAGRAPPRGENTHTQPGKNQFLKVKLFWKAVCEHANCICIPELYSLQGLECGKKVNNDNYLI